MKNFVIEEKCATSLKGSYEIQKSNWVESYKDVPGEQAYGDGFHNGYKEGYLNACADMLRYFRSNKEESNMDIIKHIMFEKK